jgi:hypothetical protein
MILESRKIWKVPSNRKGEKMKRITKLSIAGLVIAGLVGVVAPLPAVASPGCVDQSEFKKIKNGMTKARVAKLVGTKGELFSAAGSGRFKLEVRSYDACTEFGIVSIGFMGGRVESKTGVF